MGKGKVTGGGQRQEATFVVLETLYRLMVLMMKMVTGTKIIIIKYLCILFSSVYNLYLFYLIFKLYLY